MKNYEHSRHFCWLKLNKIHRCYTPPPYYLKTGKSLETLWRIQIEAKEKSIENLIDPK